MFVYIYSRVWVSVGVYRYIFIYVYKTAAAVVERECTVCWRGLWESSGMNTRERKDERERRKFVWNGKGRVTTGVQSWFITRNFFYCFLFSSCIFLVLKSKILFFFHFILIMCFSPFYFVLIRWQMIDISDCEWQCPSGSDHHLTDHHWPTTKM